MRKLIALILAVVMMASMSVSVFALQIGDSQNPATGNNNEQIDVIYDVRKGYIVVIPDDLNLTVKDSEGEVWGEGSGEVAIMMARLEGKEVLTVTAAGTAATRSGYNWVLKDQNGKATDVGYKILVNNSDLVQSTGIIVSHDSDNDPAIPSTGRKTTLTFETEKGTQAGLFKDQLTFTAAITAKQPAQS